MASEDHSRGPELLAIFGTGTAVATIMVILRLWVRTRIIRKVGADDWIVAASLVMPPPVHFRPRRFTSKNPWLMLM